MRDSKPILNAFRSMLESYDYILMKKERYDRVHVFQAQFISRSRGKFKNDQRSGQFGQSKPLSWNL